MLIHNNNRPFVVDTKRERMPVAISRHALEDKLINFRKRYRDRYPYAANYIQSGFRHLTFSHESGYALGELVKETWDDENLIWCEELPDGSTVVVIIQHGSIFEDKILPAGEDDQGLWASLLLSTDEEFAIRYFGNLPSGLAEAKGTNHLRYLESEKSLFDEIEIDSRYLLVSITEALAPPTSPALWYLAGGLVAVLIVGIAIAFNVTKNKQEEVVVDNYLAYRVTLSGSSATSVLVDVMRSVEALQFIPGWNLDQCEYSNLNLKCVFNPTQSSQTNEIHQTVETIDRDYSLIFSEGTVAVSIEVRPAQSYRPYLIVSGNEVFSIFRDLLNENVSPDSINVKQNENLVHWSTKTIGVSKNGTHLYTLIQLAQATTHKPILLERITISRVGIGFNIDSEFKLLGAN